jgi:hypothetical protein
LKGERDIHEENLDFQEQVRQVYLSWPSMSRIWRSSNAWIRMESCFPQEAISDLIVNHIDLKE